MPAPDRRYRLRAEIETHRKAADAAKREMGRLALELAEAAAASITMLLRVPQPVVKLARDFCEARATYLEETMLAGQAVEALADEERKAHMAARKEAEE